MPDSTSDNIQNRINALPKEVQDVINSPELHTTLEQIGTKHKLHIDQLGALQSETLAAMIGITNPAELAMNIAESLGIDKLESEAIEKDLNEQLFVKIRESMKRLYSQPSTNTPPAATPLTPAPARPVTISQPAPIVPVVAPVTPTIVPKAIELHPADTILTQKTVSAVPVAPAAPANIAPAAPTVPKTPGPAAAPEAPKPQPYKATDPYREPVE